MQGLYGQDDQQHVRDAVTQQNTFDNVEMERPNKGRYNVENPETEADYLEAMAIEAEQYLAGARTEEDLKRRISTLMNATRRNATCAGIDLFRRVQSDALQRQGEIAEKMLAAGFHINVMRGCLNRSVPRAIERMKDRTAKAVAGAPTPKSRCGRRAVTINHKGEAILGYVPGKPVKKVLSLIKK